ncbi:MAG TPA: RHS repeat-associated core domain-containing protein [Pirellulales bacterium]|jgi:RHS repeat-associated protein
MTQRTVLDASGNPTGETLLLTWDNRNRLASVTDYTSSAKTTENWEIHYTYDMFNNMVGRQVISHETGVASCSSHYIYDNGQIVLSLADNGAVQDRYLWAPAVDLLLAQEDASNNVDWALDDDLNSVRDWISNTGTVVQHKSYDAFGNAISNTGTLDADFGWTGRFDDPLTKLQYNTNRWYDPGIGRFISQDPIGFQGDPSNLYRYTGNRPTNATDPTGLVPPVVTNILLASDRTAPANNQGGGLLGRLNDIEAEQEKYAYFDAFHLGAYFANLRQASSGINVIQNAWSILTGGNAAQYNFTFDLLALSGSVNSIPEGTFMHELTHVLDDKEDWFLDETYSHRGQSVWRQAEGLGYAAEQIFNNIYQLQKFENDLKNRRFQSNAALNEAWQSAWSLLGSYPNTDVYVNKVNLGPVTDEDIERFSSYTGVTVSQEAVFKIYSDMVQKYYPCFELESAQTKPALR